MQLTNEEIKCIGSNLHTNFRRIGINNYDYFPGMSYEFKVENAYKRSVNLGGIIEKFVESDYIVRQYDNKYTYPAYMCHNCTFVFLCGTDRFINAKLLQEEFIEYIDVIWLDNLTLCIKIKEPTKYMMEIDLLAHYYGPLITIITRI